jgi:ABC-type dipeptide/oligopeptide/nickel transport system ATPase subunit
MIYQDPYESLDPRFRIQAAVELLDRLRRGGDMGILMITHDLSTALLSVVPNRDPRQRSTPQIPRVRR